MLLVAVFSAFIGFLLNLCRRGPRRAPTRPAFPYKPSQTAKGSGKIIPCVNPASGKKLGEAKAFTKAEVEKAIQDAKVAQVEWAKTNFDERRALLQDILDWVVENQEQIVRWATSDSGKTVTEAVMSEVMVTCEKIRWIIAHGEEALKTESRPVPTLLAFTKIARLEYHPLGVIGIIVPWNYPFHNIISAVVSAFFAGNGAVVKVSEYASYSALPIENMLKSLISRRGFDPNLINIVTGYGETGAALVSGEVDKILFIGSPAVGAKVMAGAAPNLTPVILELGGKDPFIVFDDAQFDHAVEAALRGAFFGCGQNCIAGERFYVQEKIYEKFVQAIAKRGKEIRQGFCQNPDEAVSCDVGAITMPNQLKIVEELVQDAVSKGAKVILGGKRFEHKEYKGSLYFEPTVLSEVTHEMKVANEETFGPVMPIIKFKDEADVIKLANSTIYGLGCSIFTTDYAKADRVATAIHSGMTTINDFAMVPVIQSLPFGGVKKSGFGHFNGYEGLRGFSRIHAVVSDRFPLRVAAPSWLTYPVHPNSHLIAQEAMKMVYGRTWIGSARALIQMARLIASKKRQ